MIEDIQQRMQRPSDLVSNRHSSARQTEYQNRWIVDIPQQLGGQLDAGILAISEGVAHRQNPCKRTSTWAGACHGQCILKLRGIF